MKSFLQRLLASAARYTLRRYRPKIVAITGSVGKTSTKEAVFTVLAGRYRVRRSEKNYNTEIGVPLAILGIRHYGKNVLGWLWAIGRQRLRAFLRSPGYPEILVLEMGADRPGDIEYLVGIAQPLVGVITAIGDVPVHVEFFPGPKEIAEEKAKLITAIPPEGRAVLNGDDAAVADIRGRTRARVLSFGFRKDATMRIQRYELDASGHPPGIRFGLAYNGEVATVMLKNTFGQQQAYAAAAAACVGLIFRMRLSEITRALGRYESPPGRLKLIRGEKGVFILDDTYNASPVATLAALELLASFPAKRRIAVLGDMLELGAYTEAAHRAVGERLVAAADFFIAVGERMKFAMDAAMHPGSESHRRLSSQQVRWLASSREAGAELEKLLQPGDVVLVKGSQSMRMERVVEEIMSEPHRTKELLVRQEKEWLKK